MAESRLTDWLDCWLASAAAALPRGDGSCISRCRNVSSGGGVEGRGKGEGGGEVRLAMANHTANFELPAAAAGDNSTSSFSSSVNPGMNFLRKSPRHDSAIFLLISFRERDLNWQVPRSPHLTRKRNACTILYQTSLTFGLIELFLRIGETQMRNG